MKVALPRGGGGGGSAEEVVELVLPHRRHDEEQLGEYGPKGQHAPDHGVEKGLHEPRLLRDLPRAQRQVTRASREARASEPTEDDE